MAKAYDSCHGNSPRWSAFHLWDERAVSVKLGAQRLQAPFRASNETFYFLQ